VTLSGTGVTPTTLSATTVNFGNVVVNETSAIKTVTLKNNQAVSLAISSQTVSGSGFTLDPSTTCTSTLAAGASCTIGLTLTPATTGAQTGTLTITTNAANSPQTVTLSGTGVTPTTATPVFSPAAGTYSSSQTVTITDATSGSTIYYTTNGTTPTKSSSVYSGPIMVSTTETLKAIATANGYSQSSVVASTYTIAASVTGLSPTSGAPGTQVTITDTTPGATIYYTTNGKTPSTSSTKYTTQIAESTTDTIKAIAVATGYTNSAVASTANTSNKPDVLVKRPSDSAQISTI
jgi:hypothetical protein